MNKFINISNISILEFNKLLSAINAPTLKSDNLTYYKYLKDNNIRYLKFFNPTKEYLFFDDEKIIIGSKNYKDIILNAQKSE